jgi:hypothetical protein
VLVTAEVPNTRIPKWVALPLDRSAPTIIDVAPILKSQGIQESAFADWIGDYVYFVAATESDHSLQLWRIKLPESSLRLRGSPEQLTTAPAMHFGARVIPTGDQSVTLVSTLGSILSELWHLPLDSNRMKPTGSLSQLTRHGAVGRRFHVTPDGQRLFFSSLRSGNYDIWSRDLRSGEEKLLMQTEADESPMFASTTGMTWIFEQTQRRVTKFFWIDRPDGAPRQVCESCAVLELDSSGLHTLETANQDSPRTYEFHDLG